MEFKLLIICLLVLISWVDIKKQEIPDTLSLGIIVLGVMHNGMIEERFIESLLGMGAYSLPFLFIYGYLGRVFKKEVLGFGDVKLSMGAGAVLTFTNFEKVYWLFTGSFILGGVYCIFLWIYKFFLKRKIKEELPFAPFISLALIILMVYYKG